MTLTLRIINSGNRELGVSPELVLNNRGARIGRAMTCEWVLLDDTRIISSQHCEVVYRDDSYFLVDHGSTNGTFVGDATDRLTGMHRIAPGDRFRIGLYEIEARLTGAALHRFCSDRDASAASQRAGFGDWHDVPGGRPVITETPPPQAFTDDGWEVPSAAPEQASVWSEDVRLSAGTPSADDIFGNFAAKNEVDWNNAAWTVAPAFDPFESAAENEPRFAPLPGDGRVSPGGAGLFAPLPGQAGSFDPHAAGEVSPPGPGAPAVPYPPAPATPAADPFGALPDAVPTGVTPTPAPVPTLVAAATNQYAAPPAAPVPPAPTLAGQPPAPAALAPNAVFAALLGEIGVPASQLSASPEDTAAKTGRLLRRLVAGLMILLEARARAKDEMGASGTALNLDQNNPLKFARNVDQALMLLLNPHLRGYMEAEVAVEEAYRDLQAHQIATLKAMQGALRETLNRFSPAAIKARTNELGLLAKVVPGQREAALWRAYEAQFGGVAEGSAEAFIEVFSREFRKAYDESSRRR